MKLIIWAWIIFFGTLAIGATACDEVYFKVGASYKLESHSYSEYEGVQYRWDDTSSPIGARFELGVQKGRFTAGVAHYSQWSDGWPFDNSKEPERTELFIDYKFSLWGM